VEAKKRFTFIDLLKGWALLIMIEVHVFNAFLVPGIKETSWFSILNFVNGLVAPSFTFISGFAFIISSKSNIDEMRTFGARFWKKLSRILLVILVGYSLHMPEFSFRNIITTTSPEKLEKWCNVDVLQCIGISLLILFLVRLFVKSDKVYNYFLLISSVVIIIVSPLIWNIDFVQYMPLPLACYFNEVHGSFFPLFPWMGFLFSGAYACTIYLKFRSENREEFLINKGILSGVIAFAVSTIVLIFLKTIPSFEIKPDPFFFLQRLGMVFIALGMCWKYANHFGEKSSYVTDVSRESLLIYFLHLQVIYRKVWDYKSLENLVNYNFSLVEAILSTLILVTSMIAVAKIWGSFKTRFPKASPVIIRLTLGITIILFFIVT
jgi:uncharacterized membrane protein